MPANSSFPVGGTVRTRAGGSTNTATGGKIYIWAAKRPNEVTSVDIQSDGTYVADLGSLSTQWLSTEFFYVGAVDSTDGYQGLVRFAPGGDLSFGACDIYVKNKSWEKGDGVINVTAFGAAVGGTGFDFYLIERRTDRVLACVKPAANAQSVQTYNYPGIRCHYGYYVIKVAIAGSVNGQSAGTGNAIGDTATNAVITVTVAEA